MRLIVEYKGERREFPLREGTSVAGRDPACDICIAEGSLSRRHLEIERSGYEIIVRDLKTRNGTFVGQRRIDEARLGPGARLRAGNVWMRFEQSSSSPGGAGGGAALLESRVPDAAGFHPDDVPTPADDSASHAAGGAEAGSQMIVRDGRWYVRDTATGVEVEIVPAGAEPAAPPPVVLPAVVSGRADAPSSVARAARPVVVPRRNKALKISIFALAAAMAAIAVTILLLPGKKPVQYLSLAECQERMSAAADAFAQDKADDAIAQLEQLRRLPMQTKTSLPDTLLAAFKADLAAHQSFEANFEEAEKLWNDVKRSAETGGVPSAGELARKRLLWISGETLNMASLTEAKQALSGGDFLKALSYAAQVKEQSRFYPEAPAIIEQAVARLKAGVAGRIAAQDWTGAVEAMQQLAAAVPALAPEFDAKMAQCRAYEDQRQMLAAARAEADAGTYGRAVQALEAIPQDSPYAREAAALLAQARNQALLKQAQTAYDAGDGDTALKLLAQVPGADPALVQRIKLVMAAKAAADEALQQTEFTVALDKLNEILRYEKPAQNRYAAEAKVRIDAMERMKGDAAAKLVVAADEAVQRRDFRTARRKYSEAQTLDPLNGKAAEGLKKLEDSAMRDYNTAGRLAMGSQREKETALQLYLEVADRLPPDHPWTNRVQKDIFDLRLALGQNPLDAAGGKMENRQP